MNFKEEKEKHLHKIGIYLCTCAGSIKILSNAKEYILKELHNEPNFIYVDVYNLLCTADGLDFLKNEIKKNKLDRIIIAACTPSMHEKDFMKAVEEAGLNPYYLHIINIREQGSWVIADENQLFKKIIYLIKGAVKRVNYHEPLVKKEIECSTDVLIIGGGIAGIEAALMIARSNRKVIIVEKSPFIGGMVVKYDKIYPSMECAPCAIAGNLQDCLTNKNIKVYTLSEVDNIKGFFGNFEIKIKKKARYIYPELCFGCGMCIEQCPVEVINEYEEGLTTRKAIYFPIPGALPNIPVVDKNNCIKLQSKECNNCTTNCNFGAFNWEDKDEFIEEKVGAIIIAIGGSIKSEPIVIFEDEANTLGFYSPLQLERILAENGPTKGKLITNGNKNILSVAFIHCVGRERIKYCSGICCLYSIKLGLCIKEKDSSIKITHFYKELCLPKKEHQYLYEKAIEKGIKFIHEDKVVNLSSEGKYVIMKYYNEEGQLKREIYDIAILSSGMEPNEATSQLAKMLDIKLDNRGFFEVEHKSTNPVSSIIEGIYLAGSCRGPTDIEDAVIQGSAAAGKILSKLILGKKIELEPIISKIQENLCGECQLCYTECSYGAVIKNGNIPLKINDVLCRGCGHCAAMCPSGVIELNHYTHSEIFAELDGILSGKRDPLIIAFLCQWCSYMAADNAGQLHAHYPWNIIPIKLRCIGNLDPAYVLYAFQKGADKVLILCCHPGSCHYKDGNYKTLKRITILKKLLNQFGINSNKIYFGYASKSEGHKFANICNSIIENNALANKN